MYLRRHVTEFLALGGSRPVVGIECTSVLVTPRQIRLYHCSAYVIDQIRNNYATTAYFDLRRIVELERADDRIIIRCAIRSELDIWKQSSIKATLRWNCCEGHRKIDRRGGSVLLRRIQAEVERWQQQFCPIHYECSHHGCWQGFDHDLKLYWDSPGNAGFKSSLAVSLR